MMKSREWDIRLSGLRTDHQMMIMSLRLPKGDRDIERWWMNPGILKFNRIKDICLNGMETLPGENIFFEWQAYKITLKQILQAESNTMKRKADTLRMTLEGRRKKL